ncbi:hypothetical protein [Bradyrhizobium sp. WSM471]|uniref:hypothetical protein n=1 Tax=Bradyrhizobium sp. WSM471 TaxID=319017 RepID=UPI00024D2D9B|nr:MULTISPECIES: hypothetical protein [Bradyrhizobium]EHR03226.1 hypothetical protein Bra471DRAFT_03995 [Bradyrhizobium sp. WSM471]UFW38454.1 hypothetical protein BcanWSM471_19605 [Bradyrhizobium canariense]
MPRPQRFPIKLEFWSTEAQLSGLELLTADGLSDKATHLRQALAMYLRHFGIAPPQPPRPNGQQQHQETSHVL